MGQEHLSTLLTQYGYWILIPLSLIEGPIIAFLAGTLAALGYFNIYILAAYFFFRDLAFDAAFYAIGYWGINTRFAQWILKKSRISGAHVESTRILWEKHAGKTMLLGKLSYGIAQAFIITAGAIKMSLSKFFAYGAAVAVLQYWGLLALGYFLGNAFGGSLARVILNLQYVLLAGAVVLVLYFVFSLYMRNRFWKYEEKEEKKHRI